MKSSKTQSRPGKSQDFSPGRQSPRSQDSSAKGSEGTPDEYARKEAGVILEGTNNQSPSFQQDTQEIGSVKGSGARELGYKEQSPASQSPHNTPHTRRKGETQRAKIGNGSSVGHVADDSPGADVNGQESSSPAANTGEAHVTGARGSNPRPEVYGPREIKPQTDKVTGGRSSESVSPFSRRSGDKPADADDWIAWREWPDWIDWREWPEQELDSQSPQTKPQETPDSESAQARRLPSQKDKPADARKDIPERAVKGLVSAMEDLQRGDYTVLTKRPSAVLPSKARQNPNSDEFLELGSSAETIINQFTWKLEHADGSRAQYLFKCHNSDLRKAITAVLADIETKIDELAFWTPHCDQCSNQKFVVKVDELKKSLRAQDNPGGQA